MLLILHTGPLIKENSFFLYSHPTLKPSFGAFKVFKSASVYKAIIPFRFIKTPSHGGSRVSFPTDTLDASLWYINATHPQLVRSTLKTWAGFKAPRPMSGCLLRLNSSVCQSFFFSLPPTSLVPPSLPPLQSSSTLSQPQVHLSIAILGREKASLPSLSLAEPK